MARAVFLQLGSFSNINAALLEHLRAALPEHDFDALDLRGAVTAPRTLVRSGPRAVVEYGTRLRGRAAVMNALETNSTAFRVLSARAAAHVRAAGAAFSFQTQSLFDGAVEGTPHFVYTDHTALAHRRYDDAGAAPHFPPRWLALERGVYRHARCTFATGTNVMDSLHRDYDVPSDAAALALTGLNVPMPADVSAKDYGAVEVVFVGVAWERKGGPELIAALDRLAPSTPGLRLTVVGCRPPVQRPYLHVVGRVAPAAVAAHLARATVFALPARVEPAGIAYTEASGYGLPVVATRTGGIPDRVDDGRTGLLVAPGDVDALTAALGRVLDGAELRRTLGQAGRAMVAQRFTWDAVARVIADGIRARL
ncbi:D-inositol-3-phosphate glycosyltransferase [Baekduia alba]|uniref:glycosyltransferase family 4 protein n=1 Tax=Baekduia alba TaxID=2997333 RepID=UPI002340A21B|nr:glycosyltransferase family 4 protein [Baekduia alba]WCB96001.1 D-inositol-3-phosphate glycosyltransferase [Baekduia alba]